MRPFSVSGVAKIRLVDFDYVTLSSLNRHAAAGLADVGTPKVRCLENALRKFSRWIEIDPRIEMWKKEDGGALLEGVDWVVGMSGCDKTPSPCSQSDNTQMPSTISAPRSTCCTTAIHITSRSVIRWCSKRLHVMTSARYRFSLPWVPERSPTHPEFKSATSHTPFTIHWRDPCEGD